jgi:hypothetical protein
MTNQPIKDWKVGGIKAAVWQNEKEFNGGTVSFKTLSVSRNFKKKGEDVWRSEIMNLRRNDIQKLILVLEEAQKYLFFDSKEDEDDE